MVYSASVAMPDNPKFARYTPTYFLSRHLLFLATPAVAALVAVQVPVAAVPYTPLTVPTNRPS